ncbi:MAG TPA: YetF domain-containing protein [Syntrophomonadaceae bacterium]|nr:YetF domain-containing protein [Syntrophomonadaceae bacterium]
MLYYALRAAGMYYLALLMIRLLGKRALGELGPFDFVVMTGVGHTVVSVALDKSIPYYEGIVILLTLAILEYLMGYLSLKNQRLSDLLTGRPVVLIDQGRIIKANLAREKFNIDDLLQELRKRGISDVDEVEKGILESCGGFTVVLREEDQPISRRDLGLHKAPRTEIPTNENMDRAEFLARQQQISRQAPGFLLPEALTGIEERLDQLYEKMASLEQGLKAVE